MQSAPLDDVHRTMVVASRQSESSVPQAIERVSAHRQPLGELTSHRQSFCRVIAVASDASQPNPPMARQSTVVTLSVHPEAGSQSVSKRRNIEMAPLPMHSGGAVGQTWLVGLKQATVLPGAGAQRSGA